MFKSQLPHVIVSIVPVDLAIALATSGEKGVRK